MAGQTKAKGLTIQSRSREKKIWDDIVWRRNAIGLISIASTDMFSQLVAIFPLCLVLPPQLVFAPFLTLKVSAVLAVTVSSVRSCVASLQPS